MSKVFGEAMRRRAFWSLDRLKGSPVARHLRNIEEGFANPALAEERRQERMEQLLRHTSSTTRYYRKFRGATLGELPVLTKRTIRERYSEFLSSSYTYRQLSPVTTSGSYGTPFTFLHDPAKAQRKLAEVIACNGLAGYKVGMPHLLIRTKPKHWLKRALQNEVVINATRITDHWLERQRQHLLSGRFRFVIGHASALTALTQHCARQGDGTDTYALTGIISYAEPLAESSRQRTRGLFNCTVLNRYASEELGILAHQVPEDHRLHVNGTGYIVEVLDLERDIPAPIGKLGRVVVTDLWAQAMPLIRYDIGDLAALSDSSGGRLGGGVLESLQGRHTEAIYDPEGRLVSSLAIVDAANYVLCQQHNVHEFQFVQYGQGRYALRVSCREGRLPHAVRSRLEGAFRAVLGDYAKLSFELVDSVQTLPSGKRPVVLNLTHDDTQG